MSRRTLLVDDAPILRQLVRMVLEADGSFQVVDEAGDGVEAIEKAREHRPELILLDLAMPGMGGLEALPHLRRTVPEARVVVFTGFEDPGVVESARAAGAARVLHKGLDPHALCRELHAVLDTPNEAPCRPRGPGRSRRASAAAPPRTRRAWALPGTRVRPTRLRIPLPVAVVLAVAVLLALYVAVAGVASPAPHATHYAGSFREATFQEQALAAEPGLADQLDGAAPAPYTVVVPSLSLEWTVEPDGGVAMRSASSLPWPEAHAAFERWHLERTGAAASFASLRLTTPDGEVLDDRADLVPA